MIDWEKDERWSDVFGLDDAGIAARHIQRRFLEEAVDHRIMQRARSAAKERIIRTRPNASAANATSSIS